MKKLIIISLALVLSLSAYSQTSGFGIGATVGTNIDFTIKYWTGETTAIAAAVGFDWTGGYGGIHVSGDFLFHLWSFDVGQDQMKVYLGPGVGFGFAVGNYYWDDYYWNDYSRVWMTLRAPGGVGYYFHNIPLECFAELVPGFDIFGPYGFDFRWNSYVGARWYF